MKEIKVRERKVINYNVFYVVESKEELIKEGATQFKDENYYGYDLYRNPNTDTIYGIATEMSPQLQDLYRRGIL